MEAGRRTGAESQGGVSEGDKGKIGPDMPNVATAQVVNDLTGRCGKEIEDHMLKSQVIAERIERASPCPINSPLRLSL